jgi:hypothetical protein
MRAIVQLCQGVRGHIGTAEALVRRDWRRNPVERSNKWLDLALLGAKYTPATTHDEELPLSS